MSQTTVAIEPSFKPHELSFPVPKNPHAVLHVQLWLLGGCAMVHLTTTTIGESAGSTVPLGSFVYAIPDRSNSRSAISTPLSPSGSSIDYATRLAKILAVKLGQPIYVGCSINFSGTTMEEELEGLTKVVREIIDVFQAQSQR